MKEKPSLDIWSLAHLLGGIALAVIAIFLNYPFLLTILAVIIILIAWEFYESLKKVKESPSNKIADVLIALAGFLIIYYFKENLTTATLTLILAISIILILVIFLKKRK